MEGLVEMRDMAAGLTNAVAENATHHYTRQGLALCVYKLGNFGSLRLLED